MVSRPKILICCGLITCIANLAIADTPSVLTHNPFARPSSSSPGINELPLTSNSNPAVPIDLRATLVSGQGKLANVAGRIMRPGDEIQEIRLIEVYEDHAVFVQSGRRLTVYVKPKPEEEDE